MVVQAMQRSNEWAFYQGERSVDNRIVWMGGEQPRTQVPDLWKNVQEASLSRLQGERTSVVIAGPLDEGLVTRRSLLLFNLDKYMSMQSKTSQRSNDTYNPFGRMDATHSVSSFLPSNSLEGKDDLLKKLSEIDKTYRAAISWSSTLVNGFPEWVMLQDGTQLYQYSADFQFGAHYLPTQGVQQSLPFFSITNSTRNLPQKFKHLPCQAVKKVGKMELNKKILDLWEGRKRDPDQNTVMGCGATEIALSGGYPQGNGWEWLHLVAHSMGGCDGNGPQHVCNLVAGTSECNSHMIAFEEGIKDILRKDQEATASVMVLANICDTERHISDRITYDYIVTRSNGDQEVYHAVFYPLTSQKPTVQFNKSVRTSMRFQNLGFNGPRRQHPLYDVRRLDFSPSSISGSYQMPIQEEIRDEDDEYVVKMIEEE